MALERKRLQKKKAKMAAKKKNRKPKQTKKNILSGPIVKMSIKQALESPIHECWVPEQLFDQGIGTVIVTRITKRNEILAAIFLLDVFCLGVKNCFITLMSEEEYQSQLDIINENEQLEYIHPSCARKLVEGAIEYAEKFDLHPHKDYKIAGKVFDDIEKNVCPVSFKFGKDGKPFYISGPHDNEAFSRNVLTKIMKRSEPE